jgi:hypothetical protein
MLLICCRLHFNYETTKIVATIMVILLLYDNFSNLYICSWFHIYFGYTFAKYLGQEIISSIPSAIGDSYKEHGGKDLTFTKHRREHHAWYMSGKAENFPLCRRWRKDWEWEGYTLKIETNSMSYLVGILIGVWKSKCIFSINSCAGFKNQWSRMTLIINQ